MDGVGGHDHENLQGETQLRAYPKLENPGGIGYEKSSKRPIELRPNSPLDGPPGAEKQGRNGVPKKPKGSDRMESKDGEQGCDPHIWTERERRKKMRNMFTNLHALLPQLPPKVDKSTIVDEAIIHIKALQSTLMKLENRKLERMRALSMISYDASMGVQPASKTEPREAYLANQGSSMSWATMNSKDGLLIHRVPQWLQTWSSRNVVLSVSGHDAQICICTARKPGLLPAIINILEKHKVDVITANISSDHFRSMLMIHTHANGVSDQYKGKASAVEETYKQAVGEMIRWLST